MFGNEEPISMRMPYTHTVVPYGLIPLADVYDRVLQLLQNANPSLTEQKMLGERLAICMYEIERRILYDVAVGDNRGFNTPLEMKAAYDHVRCMWKLLDSVLRTPQDKVPCRGLLEGFYKVFENFSTEVGIRKSCPIPKRKTNHVSPILLFPVIKQAWQELTGREPMTMANDVWAAVIADLINYTRILHIIGHKGGFFAPLLDGGWEEVCRKIMEGKHGCTSPVWSELVKNSIPEPLKGDQYV